MDAREFVDVMDELMMIELDHELDLEYGTEDLELERKADLLFLKVALSF
jgi:hypothetical protein